MVLDSLPDTLKIKIWRYNSTLEKDDLTYDITEVNYLPEIEDRLVEADIKYEEHLRKIHQDYGIEMNEEYVWTLPEPVIITVSKSDLAKMPERTINMLIHSSLLIKHKNKLYKLVLEYPCG